MAAEVIRLDAYRAWRRSGMTQMRYADAVGISHDNLRRLLYRDGLPSWPTAYWMAAISGEVRITGPAGTMVLVPLSRFTDERTPPPGAPAAVVPLQRREAA